MDNWIVGYFQLRNMLFPEQIESNPEQFTTNTAAGVKGRSNEATQTENMDAIGQSLTRGNYGVEQEEGYQNNTMQR
ncbi:hypothetical protein E3N88_18845 [Mikania micrantha]|uniref:Uncharacterized protein n=1 Tax=Mikania micrantha TaxID=192012 RepID=A0A5N6NMY3_9ASTR|nr:hypothetical protein E3N88_18845 [Mikania micrantha]